MKFNGKLSIYIIILEIRYSNYFVYNQHGFEVDVRPFTHQMLTPGCVAPFIVTWCLVMVGLIACCGKIYTDVGWKRNGSKIFNRMKVPLSMHGFVILLS